MLEIAKEKLDYAVESNIGDRIVKSKFPFPFDDATFEAVMFN